VKKVSILISPPPFYSLRPNEVNIRLDPRSGFFFSAATSPLLGTNRRTILPVSPFAEAVPAFRVGASTYTEPPPAPYGYFLVYSWGDPFSATSFIMWNSAGTSLKEMRLPRRRTVSCFFRAFQSLILSTWPPPPLHTVFPPPTPPAPPAHPPLYPVGFRAHFFAGGFSYPLTLRGSVFPFRRFFPPTYLAKPLFEKIQALPNRYPVFFFV